MPHRNGAPPTPGGSDTAEEPHEDALSRSDVARVTVADIARIDPGLESLVGRPA